MAFHTRLIASNCALSRCCAEVASSACHPRAKLALHPHRETEVLSLHPQTSGQIAIHHNFAVSSDFDCVICNIRTVIVFG